VDPIKQAVELARAAEGVQRPATLGGSPLAADGPSQRSSESPFKEVRLRPDHLEAHRIVAHGTSSPNGRYYDMLRTQVLQEMDKKSWQFLAVTSPTAGCGKTVTSCNLALSISRLPQRSVLLVDLDLRRPAVGKYLGIGDNGGILSVLEGRAALSSAVVQASIGPNNILVLSGSVSANSSEWMASQTMGALLQTIKRDFRSRIVIFDLPPMLLGDDVISILPRIDATLLVAGVGSTSLSDIKECQKHLRRSPVVRVVVNKATESVGSYYGHY
jgi:capsular exopolysaccharide synthesis family protein